MVNKSIWNRGLYRPLFFLLFYGCLSGDGFSKDFTVYRDKIFSKKVHLHFNTPLSFSPRANTDFKHNEFEQKFFPGINFSYGLTGICNFNTTYSLSVGFNLIWFSFTSFREQWYVPRKYYEMYISPDPQNYIPEDTRMIDKVFNPYNYFWTIPLNFLHRIPLSNRIDFRYSAGLNFKIFSQFGYLAIGRFHDVNNDTLPIPKYLEYVINEDKHYSVKFDALFSAGINQYLKNNKIINFNFFVSVPMYKPLRGKFGFMLESPYEAMGSFKKSDLAFGFEFNYIFTFVKKEKRLQQQKQVLD